MKKDRYLLVTNCDCCGSVASIIIPTEDGHDHGDIYLIPIDELQKLKTYDRVVAQALAHVLTQECTSKIEPRRAKNVYNICRRIQLQA